MKNEKISLEIATLKKALSEDMPKVVRQKIEAKIETLEKELKGSTQSGVAFAKSLLSGKKKVKAMAKVDFNALIKSLSKKPEYEFLKYLTRKQIEDDLDREAKPLGYRYVGRKNFKIPTKADIKAKRGVYYENRSNRMDINRSVRLAKGGLIEHGLKVGDEIYANSRNQKDMIFVKADDGIMYSVELNTGQRIKMNKVDMKTRSKMENGGKTDDQVTLRKVNKKKIVSDDDGTFYLTYIDSTHFYLSNNDSMQGMAFHIAEFKEREWYNEVKAWLKTNPQYANGGEIGGME